MATTGANAAIENGKVVTGKSAAQELQEKANKAAKMDKDAFLKLLVAQMKYQDPMEPTSNTEFVYQYATFSELEQMQNMSSTLELSRASSYVGQTVCIRTADTNGGYKEIEGRVDYVTFENGKAKISVEGKLYDIDEVYATIDPMYKNAVDLAVAFEEALNELPRVEDLTLGKAEAVNNLKEGYNAMTAYQQSYISDTLVEKLQKYVARLGELQKLDDSQKTDDKTDDKDKTGGTDATGGTDTSGKTDTSDTTDTTGGTGTTEPTQ